MRPRLALFLLLSLVLDCSSTPVVPAVATAGPGAKPGEDALLRYDQRLERSIHNAFAKNESLYEQLTRWSVRSLEIDVVPTKCDEGLVGHDCPSECAGLDCNERPDDWFVFHARVMVPDEHKTSCLRLSDCLEQLAAFHRQEPGHSVVTVFLDLKRGALAEDGTRTGDDLDRRLLRHIPRAWTFAPADMASRCFGSASTGSLADAAQTCGWPHVSDLAGKFIFVLTGGSGQARYAAGGTLANQRTAFVSSQGLEAKKPWAVFANLTARDLEASPTDLSGDGVIRRAYAIGRCIPLLGVCTWAGGFDDLEVPHARIQHLAVDRVRRSPEPSIGPARPGSLAATGRSGASMPLSAAGLAMP